MFYLEFSCCFMNYSICVDSIDEIYKKVFMIINEENKKNSDGECEYFFRGQSKIYEYEDFFIKGNTFLPTIFRQNMYLKNEHEIFHDCINKYPDILKYDLPTFEILSKMRHYSLPTRLLDVSSNLNVAMSFASFSEFKHNNDSNDGCVFVFKIKKEKIKYSSSDTIIALSNLAKLEPEKCCISDLGYLVHEIQKERPGFSISDPKISNKLQNDIKKVWCVKSAINNPRIFIQEGSFLIFGTEDMKSKKANFIVPSFDFSGNNFHNNNSNTDGIKVVGCIKLTSGLKSKIREYSKYLGVSFERLYPDFQTFHQYGLEKYKK